MKVVYLPFSFVGSKPDHDCIKTLNIILIIHTGQKCFNQKSNIILGISHSVELMDNLHVRLNFNLSGEGNQTPQLKRT